MQLLHSVSVFPSQCRNTMTFFLLENGQRYPHKSKREFYNICRIHRPLPPPALLPPIAQKRSWTPTGQFAMPPPMKDFLPADFFWRNTESPVKPFSLHEKPYHKSGFQKMSRIPHALKEAAFFWRVPESQGEVFVRFLCMPLSAVLWLPGGERSYPLFHGSNL